MNEKDIETKQERAFKEMLRLGLLFDYEVATNQQKIDDYHDKHYLEIKNNNGEYNFPLFDFYSDRFYRCNDILEKLKNDNVSFTKIVECFLFFLSMQGLTLECVVSRFPTPSQEIFVDELQKKDMLKKFRDILSNYLVITDDFKVIPVDPVVNAVRQIPECEEICRYYDQNDIKSALVELRRLYEEDKFNKFIEGNSNEVKFISKFFIKMASIYAVHFAGKGVGKERIQQTEFADRTKKLQNALNEYKNTNGIITNNNDILEKLQEYSGFMFNHMIDQKNLQLAYQDMTETEARIWLDLGLSIYRLYLMNSK